jgi:hypothetical protein
VIDWEWTYAGPYQFLFSPPSWLILERPTSWTSSGEARYRAQLLVFLKSLEEEEAQREVEMGEEVPADQKMSTLMRQSMEDGKFWLNELIRESFNFDEEVLWPSIEPLLERYGLVELGIPGESEVQAFVRRKMADLDQYKLDLQALEEERQKKKEMEGEAEAEAEAEASRIAKEVNPPIGWPAPPGRTALA